MAINLKPPRYLLREALLKEILKNWKPGKFLEIGYGAGNMLVTLAQLGYKGDGYDFSEDAKKEANSLLKVNAITNVKLLNKIDTDIQYDYILFFELIGYWRDPASEISRLKNSLYPGGKMIFSFTSKRFSGYAEKLTGDMKCFTRNDIMRFIEADKELKVNLMWNYGFPLTNVLKPLLDLYYFVKCRFGTISTDNTTNVEKSGLATRHILIKFASLLLNPLTIYPFAKIQSLFKNTDLGNGYIVVVDKLE